MIDFSSPAVDVRHAYGHGTMIATGHPLAADAAELMLGAGGSAIDAAIAADAVMGVVEPMATSIGGDLQAMIVVPDGTAITCNGTGRAPAALTANMVERLPGGRIPERHPLSVTVPGAVRGWSDLHQRFGRLDWRQLFAPAIRIATDGFAVAPTAAREWRWFDRVLHADRECARLYRAGKPPQAGERFCNPELANVLRMVASDGPDAFYSGPVAQAVERGLAAHGGVLTTHDLARHESDWRAPVRARFRGLILLECPPNSHGQAVLDALQWADLACDGLDPADPAANLILVRAMRDALARARETVADSSGNTVCTVVVDGSGLAVTLMSSIFKRFGCGIVAPGCGFVLQNRGFGFASPGHVNGPAPAKRPYHTVVPAAALKDGRFHAGFGVVGGLMQPQGQVQLLWRIAAMGQSLHSAMAAPRWRLESGERLAIEPGTAANVEQVLRKAGFDAPPSGSGELAGRSDFGGAQFVMRLPDGRLEGCSDPRKDGVARGDDGVAPLAAQPI